MLTIYADGACSGNPGPAGSAILLLEPQGGKLVTIGSEERALGHGTNQIAELVAASMAIEAAIKHSATEITVRCDSEYVVKGINDWMAGWIRNGWRNASKKPVANKEHWLTILDGLNRARGDLGKTIRFEWVRGHDSDVFNNQVDELAVAASRMKPGHNVSLPAKGQDPSMVPAQELNRVVSMAEAASRDNDERIKLLTEKLEFAISWIEDLPRKNASHQMLDHHLNDLRAALGR